MWLKAQSESRGQALRITWGNGEGVYPLSYSVGVETLKQAAGKLHDRLNDLAEWAKSEISDQLPSLLRRLAQAGAGLRFALFDAVPEDGGTAPDISDLMNWIWGEYAAGDRSLAITAPPDLHIPWGLIYEGDPALLPDQARYIDDFAGFWVVRHTLSVVLSGSEQTKAKTPRPRQSFRILSMLNRYEFYADELVDRDQFQRLLNLPVGISYNIDAAEKLINDAARKDTILHFFGHGENGELDLGDGQRIDVLRFKMMLQRLTGRDGTRGVSSCSLIFINACESAIGDSDYSLRSATARPGLCGLIATEAKIPRLFATRFGHRFLDAIVNRGRSVGEAMEELRCDPAYWPLSLLYGCYAYPGYRIGQRSPETELQQEAA